MTFGRKVAIRIRYYYDNEQKVFVIQSATGLSCCGGCSCRMKIVHFRRKYGDAMTEKNILRQAKQNSRSSSIQLISLLPSSLTLPKRNVANHIMDWFQCVPTRIWDTSITYSAAVTVRFSTTVRIEWMSTFDQQSVMIHFLE